MLPVSYEEFPTKVFLLNDSYLISRAVRSVARTARGLGAHKLTGRLGNYACRERLAVQPPHSTSQMFKPGTANVDRTALPGPVLRVHVMPRRGASTKRAN